jgi:hypothetical protein
MRLAVLILVLVALTSLFAGSLAAHGPQSNSFEGAAPNGDTFAAGPRPRFAGAIERWSCVWVDADDHEVLRYFGLFNSYVQAESKERLSVLLNSKDSLVFAGKSDSPGSSIDKVSPNPSLMIRINRRDNSMLAAFLEADSSKSQYYHGLCSTYGGSAPRRAGQWRLRGPEGP